MSAPLYTREDLPGSTTPSGGWEGNGGMTLPLLLAIAIGGGVLLFICLAFLLIALAGRRHRARTRSAQCSPRSGEGGGDVEICASDGDGSPRTRTPSPRPRRLRKTNPTTYMDMDMDMVEIREKQPQPPSNRSLASIIGRMARSKTFNVFGTPTEEAAEGYQRGGHLRRNHSWIDEDAIHGPSILNDERRLGIRDSFILRSPTLPDFSTFKEEEAFADFRRFSADHLQQQQYQRQQPPRQVMSSLLPAQRGGGLPPRVPLMRTASYGLAEQLAAAAPGGVPPLPPALDPSSSQCLATCVPIPVPLSRLRHKTTESDLAEILRSTEERLQNGTPSNSRPATRQRTNSASAGLGVRTPTKGSPTKSSYSPVKIGGGSPVRPSQSPTKSQSPVKLNSPVKNVVINHVGQALDSTTTSSAHNRTRTPSPSKRIVGQFLVQTPVHHHRRNTSKSSAVSDADSLFGETTPELMEHILPAGLSSPSRRSDNDSPGNGPKTEDRCTSMRSLGSNASSSLSTLYSVNEPEDDSKTGISKGEGIVRGSSKPKGLIIDTQMCDPFVTPPPPPLVPLRSPKRHASSLPPLHRISPPDEEQSSTMERSFSSKSVCNSPIPRPLDVVKRGSTADGIPTRLSMMTMMQHSPDLAATLESIRPKSVASMKPVFLISSTRVGSMKANPGTSPEDNANNNNNNHYRPEMPSNRSTFGQKPIFPPPLNLRPGQGSSHREAALVMGSPEGTLAIMGGGDVSSPTLRAVRNSPRESSPSASPTCRPPLPSPEQQHQQQLLLGESRRSGSSPTLGRYKRRGMASPIRERMLSRQLGTTPRENRADRMVPSISDCPSIILLQPSDESPSQRNKPFHRDFAVMGLQSTVAQLRRMNSQMSTLSGASSVSDPDSPTLPNMRGGGFSPDRSNSRVSRIGRQNYLSLGMSPRAKRNTIKGARISTAVIKGPPGAARPDGFRAAVEEKEDEASASASEVIRGPRPLNPTPRSAGRGGHRASTGVMDSPTQRRRSGRLEGEMVGDGDERRVEKAKHQE